MRVEPTQQTTRESSATSVACSDSSLSAPQESSAFNADRLLEWFFDHAPRGLVIGALLAIAAAYAVGHNWLCDDAFISFRYARNLAEGHGLVFNIGERVEGYTNFLWVLELAALLKVFGIAPEHGSVALSAMLSLATLGVTAALARRTPFTSRAFIATAAALLLLAVNRNFAVWTTSGLETRQFTFCVVLAIWLQERAQREHRSLVPASLAWSAAALTRPDGQLLLGCALAWWLVRSIMQRTLKPRALAELIGPTLLLLGTHLIFRHSYYGDWLPNTYYAKHVRPWPEAGFMYLTAAAIENALYLVGPLAVVGAFARWVLRRDDVLAFALPVIAMHAGYWAWIGGDHFEFRPMDMYWPFLAVAAVDGWLAIVAGLEAWLRRREISRATSLAALTGGFLMAVIIAYSTVLQVAQASLTHDLKTRQETLGLHADISLNTFPAAFVLPWLDDVLPAYNAALRFTAAHSIGLRWKEHQVFWKQQRDGYGPYGKYAAKLFSPDMVMSYSTVGIAPYNLGQLTVIDMLGLTDRTVARNPVTRPNRERQLAHDRAPPAGYLEKRGVNLEVFPAARSLDEARAQAPYALRLEEQLWMPLSSPNPAWLERKFADHGLWQVQLGAHLHDNKLIVDGRSVRGSRALGFFDGDLDEWTRSGQAMSEQPVSAAGKSQQLISGGMGAALINTFAPGDAARGELWSPLFVPSSEDILAFLVGGGADGNVGVELLVADKPVQSWRGNGSEVLRLVVHDLAPYADKSCRLRIYDESANGWGHVLADHFMLLR